MAVDTSRAECSLHSARDLAAVAHPKLTAASTIQERIIVGPKGVGASATAGDAFSPTRIGFLSDMPMGGALGAYLDPIIMALEDATMKAG
jgi:hypothetical protein